MAKRTDTYGDALKDLVQMYKSMDLAQTEEWFKKLTGRDIYEMQTRTLMNKTVIDRPVSLALNGVSIVLSSGKGDAEETEDEEKEDIKSVDPVDIMTNCMIDGFAVVRLGTGWKTLSIEKPEDIKILETDGDGFITKLRIQHPTIDKNTKAKGFFRRDYFLEFAVDEEGKPIDDENKQAFRQDWPVVAEEKDFEKATPKTKIEIPFIPFVAFEWNKLHISFLVTKKLAFLELERVSKEISGENVRHSKRKLFVKLPRGTDLKLEYLGDNVNLLTEKGEAFYPDPHSAVINGFFQERKDQVEFIENATGVVATEKIVALSGVSRLTAMKSLTDLAKKVRKIFLDGMMRIEKIFQDNGDNGFDTRQMLILFPPLGMLIVDVNNQAALLKEAFKEGLISKHEYRESVRMMLGL